MENTHQKNSRRTTGRDQLESRPKPSLSQRTKKKKSFTVKKEDAQKRRRTSRNVYQPKQGHYVMLQCIPFTASNVLNAKSLIQEAFCLTWNSNKGILFY